LEKKGNFMATELDAEVARLNALLDGGNSQLSSEVDALNNLLGTPKKISSDNAALTGFTTGVERLTHGAMQPLLESGWLGNAIAQGSKDYAKQREADYAQAAAAHPWRAGIGNFVGALGASLPTFALPMSGAPGLAGLAKNVGSAALGGGLVGGAQYVPEGGSRLFNTALGGTLGATLPLAFAGANKLADSAFMQILSPKTGAIDDLARQGIDPTQALATKTAADRLNVSITPAEASGSQLAGKAQGRLGISNEGALKLQEFAKNRTMQEKSAINSLLDDISPDDTPAAADVRRVANKVIQADTSALQQKARPVYDTAYKATVPVDDLKSVFDEPIIANAANKISNDPIYASELKGVPKNSIQYLDLVKRNVDDQISTANRAGEKNTVRLLMNAKEKLVNSMDEVSPDYKMARSIFGDGSKPLQQLNESNIGRIANLKDTQLKQVSKIIFDSGETNPKILNQIRTRISKQDAETWNRITRNWMEGELNNTPGTGSSFYKKILGNDRKFNQAMSAVQNIPGAPEKLSDMREVFKNLINPTTPRTAASLAKSYLDAPRSTAQFFKDMADKIVGGRYDNAAIDLITSNNWDKELAKIKAAKGPLLRGQGYANLLSKIATIQSTNLNNQMLAGSDQNA
jgi:hypothetical protein